jgi:CxxC-x17-CxxC domain-containing protein
MPTDLTLICRDCNTPFTFGSDEQDLYASRGFDKPPGRCAECRKTRRANHDRQSGVLGRTAGGQMFQATCVTCGGGALVRFEPRPGQAVHCARCYQRR